MQNELRWEMTSLWFWSVSCKIPVEKLAARCYNRHIFQKTPGMLGQIEEENRRNMGARIWVTQ